MNFLGILPHPAYPYNTLPMNVKLLIYPILYILAYVNKGIYRMRVDKHLTFIGYVLEGYAGWGKSPTKVRFCITSVLHLQYENTR